jgi:hypothetical protein
MLAVVVVVDRLGDDIFCVLYLDEKSETLVIMIGF